MKTSNITPSDLLRMAAIRMQKYGFSPAVHDGRKSCFLGHLMRVERAVRRTHDMPHSVASKAIDIIAEVADCCQKKLEARPWPKRDAVAALNIAADLAN